MENKPSLKLVINQNISTHRIVEINNKLFISKDEYDAIKERDEKSRKSIFTMKQYLDEANSWLSFYRQEGPKPDES